MDRDAYIQQAYTQASDPKDAWRWALRERERNPDQALADAEHYLWNAYYASQGPIEAIGGLLTPFGYYAGKKIGLLGGRSEPQLSQLQAGLAGALKGIGL